MRPDVLKRKIKTIEEEEKTIYLDCETTWFIEE
jgi:hypothetical protein